MFTVSTNVCGTRAFGHFRDNKGLLCSDEAQSQTRHCVSLSQVVQTDVQIRSGRSYIAMSLLVTKDDKEDWLTID